jgi:hypothetical protein
MNYFFGEEEENDIYSSQNNKYIITNLNDLNSKEIDNENVLIKTFKFFNINNLSEFNTNTNINTHTNSFSASAIANASAENLIKNKLEEEKLNQIKLKKKKKYIIFY